MKKIINALFLLAVSAVALTSCSDVPAPYDTPNQNSNNPTTPTIATPIGSGTEADPYNVAAAIKKLKDEPADQNTAPITISSIKTIPITSFIFSRVSSSPMRSLQQPIKLR